LESSQRGLQLFFRPHRDQRSAQEYMVLQSCKSPNRGNFGIPVWESRDKAIWMWASRRGTKYTIWGKVMASLESGPWWVLWVRGRLWLVLAPKVFQPCVNQRVCWFCACLHEWVNCLSLFLVPS
jgi:hypothetical protein